MSKKFDKRKKVVYDLICDDLYTPMKFKELAMLLRVAKEDRDELRQILEALEQEGKIYLSKRGKYCRGHAKRLTGVFRASLKVTNVKLTPITIGNFAPTFPIGYN